MKIIVSGSTGFVGKKIVQELHTQGHEVIALIRDKTKVPLFWNDSIETIVCPISQYSTIQINHKLKGDIFFHFAWEGTAGDMRGSVEIQLGNVQHAIEALQLAKQCGCYRFVYAGSIMEYEAMEYIQKDEAKPGKGYIYSTAKLTADFMLKTIAFAEKNIAMLN